MLKKCIDQVKELYDITYLCCEGYHPIHYTLGVGDTMISIWSLFKKSIRAIFMRNNTDDLDKDISLKEYQILHDALKKTASANHIDLTDYRDPQARTLQRLRTNLVTFVAFKNYNRSQDMIRALIDEHGKIRSFADFQRQVINIGEAYHRHQLEAEYTTVVSAAQTAAQWEDFVRDADIYPYLVYKTQHDNKVRKSHQLLHDVCKHITDDFWDTWYPPNGWRCRCYILQSRTADGYKTEPDAYPDDKSIPPVFRHNPAKSGKVWNEKHPYFIGINDDIKAKIMSTRNQLMKADTMYDTIDGVQVHYSNYFSTSFDSELRMAKTLKSVYNHSVKMLSQFDDPNITTPDYLIDDNIIAEYKHFSSTNLKNIIDTLRKNAIKQLLNNNHSKEFKKIVIISIPKEVNSSELLSIFRTSNRVKTHNIELWIQQHDSIIKNNAE